MTDVQPEVATQVWTMNDSYTWLAEYCGHPGEWRTLFNANPGAWYDEHVPPIGTPITLPAGWSWPAIMPPTSTHVGGRLTQ